MALRHGDLREGYSQQSTPSETPPPLSSSHQRAGADMGKRRSGGGCGAFGPIVVLAAVGWIGDWVIDSHERGDDGPLLTIILSAAAIVVVAAALYGLKVRLATWAARRDRRLYPEPDLLWHCTDLEARQYQAMTSKQFEEAIAALCLRSGCLDAHVTGGANDLGADVVATTPNGQRLVIQCKRYGERTKVGSPELQRFGGTCFSVHGAKVAIVVTTSVFTLPATRYAEAQGIRLVDGAALAAWATGMDSPPWGHV